MKALSLLLASFPLLAAPTNEWGTLTFTNNSGMVVTNALVTSVHPDRVVFRTERGGGTARLADLPQELQTRFGYDPGLAKSLEAARKAESEAYKVKAAAQAAIIQKQVAEQNARFKQDQEKVAIYGRVIQKHQDGLRISPLPITRRVPAGVSGSIVEDVDTGAEGRTLIRSESFLVSHPNFRNIADGDLVDIAVWPDGTHEYNTVGGSSRSLRRYTALRPALH